MEIYFRFHFHCIAVKGHSMPACVCVCAKTVKSNKNLIKIQHNKHTEREGERETEGEIFNKQLYSSFFPWYFVCLLTAHAVPPLLPPPITLGFLAFYQVCIYGEYEYDDVDFKIERFIYARAYLFALQTT